MKIKVDPRIFLVGAGVSLLAILPLDIGFYTFVRITICLSAIYGAYCFYRKEHVLWIVFGLIAILYNPIVPIYLKEKAIWAFVNILTALVFLYAFRKSSYMNDRIFLYLGKFIFVGGSCFTTILLYIALTEGVFDSDSYSYRPLFGALTISVFGICTFICSKLFNYFFLNNSAYWIHSADNKSKEAN